LFQGYLNIYNNYFKAPWMPDRTEANPNELNQDDARYGFRCCHLKNIWTAPLPPEIGRASCRERVKLSDDDAERRRRMKHKTCDPRQEKPYEQSHENYHPKHWT